MDRLRENLVRAKSPRDKFALLEDALLDRAALQFAPHPAIRSALGKLMRNSAVLTVAEMTRQTGMSRGRFIECFREGVGLTPKRFARIARFQHALRLIDRQEESSWADLAIRAGYFDQAHFIHEFRALAGYTPSDYLRYQSSVPNRQLVWE